MNLEFTFGCVIGLAYARFGPRHLLGTALLAIGTLLLVCSLFFGDFNTGIANYIFSGALSWYRVAIWGVPAASITAGVVFRSRQIRSAPARLGVRLGDASYSIYLISGMVFYGYKMIYRFLAPLGPDANVAIALLTVAGVGWLCYRYVEAPLTHWIKATYHRPAVQSAP